MEKRYLKGYQIPNIHCQPYSWIYVDLITQIFQVLEKIRMQKLDLLETMTQRNNELKQ